MNLLSHCEAVFTIPVGPLDVSVIAKFEYQPAEAGERGPYARQPGIAESVDVQTLECNSLDAELTDGFLETLRVAMKAELEEEILALICEEREVSRPRTGRRVPLLHRDMMDESRAEGSIKKAGELASEFYEILEIKN